MDNVPAPDPHPKGADLPLLLISRRDRRPDRIGIVEFVPGPVVLAVTYTLLKQWVGEQDVPGSART